MKKKITLTDEQKAMARKLTDLQRKTVINMVAGMDRVAAYRAAGGKAKDPRSASNTVGVMLDKDGVRDFHDSLIESSATDSIMTRTEALERLSVLARTDLADLVEFGTHEFEGPDGEKITQAVWSFKDSVLQDPAKLAAIAELSATKDGLKIKTHSVLAAIQQLAKMEGWESATKVDHTTAGKPLHRTAAELTDEELAAIAASYEHQSE